MRSALSPRQAALMDRLVADPDTTDEELAEDMRLSVGWVKAQLGAVRGAYGVQTTRAAILTHDRLTRRSRSRRRPVPADQMELL